MKHPLQQILILDDDLKRAFLKKLLLQKMFSNTQIEIFTSCLTALKTITKNLGNTQHEGYSLMIINLYLDSSNGLEFSNLLREYHEINAKHKTSPFIIIDTPSIREYREIAIRMGERFKEPSYLIEPPFTESVVLNIASHFQMFHLRNSIRSGKKSSDSDTHSRIAG